MAWEFERLEDSNLHGLSTGARERRAIHVHGSWGNFYENSIALGTSESYARFGFGHASVNTSGHDGGTAVEDLATTTADLVAWQDYFVGRGTQEWILQGHSLGALKLIRALTDGVVGKDVRAVVLMSPFDLPAFYARSGSSAEIDAKRAQVEALARENGAEVYVPASVFDIWPVSAGTMAAALTRGGALDVFVSREGRAHTLLPNDIPTLVLLGGEDFAATPNPQTVRDQLSDAKVTVELIDGAPHNFAGHEAEVNLAIGRFLDSVL